VKATAPPRRPTIPLEVLPPPSSTMTWVLEAIGRPRLSAGDIAELIETDAVVAAELLRAANCAYYGVASTVTSVQKAVVLLGARRALSLAVGVAALANMTRVRFPPGFDHEGLWGHLRGAALAARWLVEPVHPESADTAYMAALLHDVGKALMAAAFTSDWQRIRQATKESPVSFAQAEAALGTPSHAGLGSTLLEHWQLPEQICRLVRRHHEPVQPGDPDAELAAALRRADALARLAGVGNPGDRAGASLEAVDPAGNSDAVRQTVERLRQASPPLLGITQR